ncbi:MAG: ABC transporter ATP-binding protein [Bacillota bacterium]
MSLIKVEEASFAYQDKLVLQDISFELQAGGILSLLGPNGSGKSTLLDCILGLQKLDQGRILIAGSEISNLSASQIAKQIAYVPQMSEKFFPYTVLEMVAMGRAAYTSLFSSPNREDVLIAKEALELVDMLDYEDRSYTQLSGGQRQLVMIARALAQQTPIIVMDEPTAHLDFEHELKTLEIVSRLIKEEELTLIIATHFPNQVFYFENQGLTTTVVMLNNQSVAAAGRSDKVLTVDNLERIFNIKAQKVTYQDELQGKKDYIIPLQTVN